MNEPFVDYRERWPVDFSAANDTPDRLPEWVQRTPDPYWDRRERQERRAFRVRVLGMGLLIAGMLGVAAWAVDNLLEIAAPAAELEHPANP